MFDFLSISIKPRGPMTSPYTLRAIDFPLPLKFLVSYGTNQLMSTRNNDVDKISHFLTWFSFRHLLVPLGPADHP